MADDSSADSSDAGAPPSPFETSGTSSAAGSSSKFPATGSGSKFPATGSDSKFPASGSGSGLKSEPVVNSPKPESAGWSTTIQAASEDGAESTAATSTGSLASDAQVASDAQMVSDAQMASAQETPESSASPAQRKKHRKKGDLDLAQARIGFLGAGKMTESIVEGLIKFGNIPSKHIFVAAPSRKNLAPFKEKGCHVSRRLLDIFARYDCDVVFFCFHGSVVKKCYKQGGHERPFPITTNYIPNNRHPLYLLSLVSGVTLGHLKKCLLNPDHPHKYVLEMHRIMVNTAVAEGVGICGIDCDPDSSRLSAPIRSLLGSFAQLEFIPENEMDAACSIAGSGLAFSFYFINALADGAFKCGLARPLALKLAAKTALSTAKSVIQSSRHPSELRDEASAPAGSALFGIHILDKAEVASGVTAAVEAAHKRATQMAREA